MSTGQTGTMAIRIGVLECDHVDDRFRSIQGDYVDMFAALFDEAAKSEPGHAVDVVAYDAIGGRLPASPAACDAWVVTGSRYSVYDDRPWIVALGRFVREVRDAGVPFAGICFGHQLLAHALGGRTEKAASGWGVGAIDTWLTPVEPLSEGRDAGNPAVLLYLHQDQVVALPPGAEVIARAPHCPIAGLRAGAMVGIQAHPEFSADYLAALVGTREERIGVEATAAARKSLDRYDAGYDGDGNSRDALAVGRFLVRFLSGGAQPSGAQQ